MGQCLTRNRADIQRRATMARSVQLGSAVGCRSPTTLGPALRKQNPMQIRSRFRRGKGFPLNFAVAPTSLHKAVREARPANHRGPPEVHHKRSGGVSVYAATEPSLRLTEETLLSA